MSRLGLTLIVAALVTISVTEIDWGLLEAPVVLIATFPEYVPVPSPAGLAEMLRLAGVVPLLGLTDSHLPPEVVVAEALNVRAVPLLSTATLCPPGRELPVW